MSKTIDLSGGVEGLDDDDLLYLAQRDNADAAAELANRGLSIDGSKETPLEELPNTGDANTAGLTIEQLEAKLEAMKAEQAAEEAEDEGLEPPYEEYTNDQLRTEILRRNENRDEDDPLSLGGAKADLVAELERDDSENEE